MTPVQAADLLQPAPPRPANGVVRVLMIGDVIGKPGRLALEHVLHALRDERHIDLVVANGENLAGGMGLTIGTAAGLFDAGVDVITSGNHIWDKREIYPELDRDERILRPINYGETDVPGRGWGIFHATRRDRGRGHQRPGPDLHGADREPVHDARRSCSISGAVELPPVRLVDFHCELTSEKNAFGVYLDGRVSAVCGTHTHVATADERILPRGSGYVSDIGMTGPLYSVIGFDHGRCCRASSTRCRRASRLARARSCSMPCRSTSTRRHGRARHVARISRVIDTE